MSEPNSLFAKIHITKDNFDNFQKTNPKTPKLDNDWLDWWNSKEMYGKTELKEVYTYDDPTNESIINGWKDAKHSLTFSDYDLENEIWHFGIITFSEHYTEMIPGLAFIKSVAEFKTENKEDFAVVYNYFWGDNYVCAYINYENDKGLFDNKIQTKSELNPNSLKYAEEYLSKKWEEFEATGATDEYE